MVIRALYYILTICSVLAIFLLFQEPYFLDLTKNTNNIANMQVYNIEDFEISDKVDKILRAKKAIRYAHEDVLFDGNLSYIHDGLNYFLTSKKMKLKDKIITLSKDVVLNRNDGLEFKSEQLKYDFENKLIFTDVPFNAFGYKTIVNGDRLRYDLKTKNMLVYGVKASYELEKK